MTKAEQKEAESIYQQIKYGLETYFKESGFKKAVLGLSGGVDSTVTLKIAVDTLGAENVTAILMPENGVTKQENTAQSKKLCEFFNVQYFVQAINPYILNYSALPWKQKQIAFINTKARLRASILYNYANSFESLVLGTSNKSELLLGYGTKFGDLAADMYVIGSIFKTDVYKLAEYLGLPDEIIKKKPSAELYEGQTDEDELGGSYKDIDNILKQLDLGEENLISKGINPVLVRHIFKLHEKNQHKLQLPYIIPVAGFDEIPPALISEDDIELNEPTLEEEAELAEEDLSIEQPETPPMPDEETEAPADTESDDVTDYETESQEVTIPPLSDELETQEKSPQGTDDSPEVPPRPDLAEQGASQEVELPPIPNPQVNEEKPA